MIGRRICGLTWRAALALLIGGGSAQAEPADGNAASPAVFELATLATKSGDTRGRPFIIIDKRAARVFAFDATGAQVAQTPALLGAARGDVSPPGVGNLPLARITPPMRITPAGRYEARLGMNLAGRSILWVDYDEALSLHPVVTSNAAERRLQRLATPSISDNRISYGCINVPKHFYEDVVEPLFAPADGVVYILPESAVSPVRLLASK